MPDWPWSRALVTGASSGIGDAFARVLAASGVDLVVVARTEPALRDLAEELRAAHNVQVDVLAADLARADHVAKVEARVASADSPVDLLVNNAGFGTTGRFDALDIDEEVREVLVNNVALLRLTHAAVGRMARERRGAVVNVASIAALQPTPYTATYGASKAFVLNLSEALHEEYRKQGVTITALCPGFTRTSFQENAGYDASGMPRFAWMDATEVAEQALHAAAKGAAVCVPGAINKALAVTTGVAPRRVNRRVAGFVSGRRNH